MKILWIALALLCALLLIASLSVYALMIWMPGPAQPVQSLPATEDLSPLERQLAQHVNTLSEEIGERNHLLPSELEEAADYIQSAFAAQGYEPLIQSFGNDEHSYKNIEVIKKGTRLPEEIVVIGAHYDTLRGSPGADDNASGVAVLLELSRLLQDADLPRTIHFVAFTNEEHPHAETELMGSRVYAKRAKNSNDPIVAMISLESLGIYSDRTGSQGYPPPLSWFYPNTGNFVAFVANLASRALARQTIATFRAHARIPSEGVAAPENWVPDIRRSDHSSFWDQGYPAIMVTDTAPFRYAHYHTARDLPENLAYPEMAAATLGLRQVVETLAVDQ